MKIAYVERCLATYNGITCRTTTVPFNRPRVAGAGGRATSKGSSRRSIPRQSSGEWGSEVYIGVIFLAFLHERLMAVVVVVGGGVVFGVGVGVTLVLLLLSWRPLVTPFAQNTGGNDGLSDLISFVRNHPLPGFRRHGRRLRCESALRGRVHPPSVGNGATERERHGARRRADGAGGTDCTKSRSSIAQQLRGGCVHARKAGRKLWKHTSTSLEHPFAALSARTARIQGDVHLPHFSAPSLLVLSGGPMYPRRPGERQ